MKEFTLSLEELAMAFTVLESHEDAAQLLSVYYRDLPPEILRAYLEAASHSLLARGWLALSSENRLVLHEDLAHLIRQIQQTQFSLQYRKRTVRGEQSVLSFHFASKVIVSHLVAVDVVHTLGDATLEEILVAGLKFFEVPLPSETKGAQEEKEEQSEVSFRISSETFRTLYQEGYRGLPENLLNDIDEKARALLVEDLHNQTLRGVILTIEYDEQRRPQAQEGAFVLSSQARGWLFVPQEAGNAFIVQLLTPKIFAKWLEDLVKKKR